MTRRQMITGIYVIHGVRNRAYVGASVRCRGRLTDHQCMLRAGRHHSQKMQRDWDQHGASFTFTILEECTVDQLFIRERFWTQHLRTTTRGYNHSDPVRSTIYSIKSRAKISQAVRRKFYMPDGTPRRRHQQRKEKC